MLIMKVHRLQRQHKELLFKHIVIPRSFTDFLTLKFFIQFDRDMPNAWPHFEPRRKMLYPLITLFPVIEVD